MDTQDNGGIAYCDDCGYAANYEKAECIPPVGFKCVITQGNVQIQIEVVDMDGKRIDKVLASPLPPLEIAPQPPET